MKYFISDTHFGHKNLLKFERFEFEDINEHDEFIINSINSRVKLTDTLYILGDVGNPEMIRRLNGYKILIMGNHDKRPSQEYLSYFSQVYEHPIYINKRLVLSHEPIQVNQDVLNVHGHLHGSKLFSCNHFNISAKLIDYIPVDLQTISTMSNSLKRMSDNFLEEWYADKYVFVNPNSRSDVVVDLNGRILLSETRKHRNSFKKNVENDD